MVIFNYISFQFSMILANKKEKKKGRFIFSRVLIHVMHAFFDLIVSKVQSSYDYVWNLKEQKQKTLCLIT